MFWQQVTLAIIGFFSYALLIVLSNWLLLRRLDQNRQPARYVRVSVLVPARNEAHNIEQCVNSLLAQDYPNFEVLVLDDGSTDGTGEMLKRMSAADERLTGWQGAPMPEGWLGKHWACQQLAEAAQGELLLFTDADTWFHPRTLADTVATMQATQADLLTGFPYEVVKTWSEKLVVPVVIWGMFGFVPMWLMERIRIPIVTFAVGQYMCFRRTAYQAIGGHESVRGNVVDDLALGRRVKAAGLRLRLVDATARVRCRMYHNYQQVRDGFSKNLFAAFGYNIPVFIIIWLWMLFAALMPASGLVMHAAGANLPGFSTTLAGLSIGINLLFWVLVYVRLRYALYLVFLYPAAMLLCVYIAFRSLVMTLAGKTTWKGRSAAGS